MIPIYSMFEKLQALADEYAALSLQIQQPGTLSNPGEIARIGKRLSVLEPLVHLLDEHRKMSAAVAYVDQVRGDPEMLALAEDEAQAAKSRLPLLEQEMKAYLVPRDPDDDKSVILEVRAGTGGEEAALFAGELMRMYLRYAEMQGWTVEMMSISAADGGGVKEASCKIEGRGAYGKLKYESGVHRVQRIPATENKGRVHTSTVTVAILPEAEEVDLTIRPEDLRIDTFRSGGAGGQNVNKVESAVRVTHLPTGVAVACQTERSQQKNRVLAMNLLRSRLYSAERDRLAKERGDMRSGQIGSGDRSEKIRTYNFPQDRLTDHRIGESFSNLPSLMEGNIGKLVETLREKDQQDKIAKLERK